MRRKFIQLATMLVMVSCENPVMEEEAVKEADSITTEQSPGPYYEATDGVEPIELGLSVKWAPMNIGAEDIYDGENSFFAWGETMTKESFTWQNYIHGESRSLTRYSWGIYGSADDIEPGGNLNIKDDAAHAYWGNHWRMPTEKEFKELIDACSWTKDTETMSLVGTAPNGNTIRFPVAGYKIGDKLNCAGQISSVAYWTSTISRYDPAFAYQAIMEITDIGNLDEDTGFRVLMNSKGAGQNRAFGYYIRAVYVK